MCLKKLKDRGLLVTQSGPCGVLTDWDVFRPINHTLRTVFPNVTAYSGTDDSFFVVVSYIFISSRKK
jgi:spermidine synthase